MQNDFIFFLSSSSSSHYWLPLSMSNLPKPTEKRNVNGEKKTAYNKKIEVFIACIDFFSVAKGKNLFSICHIFRHTQITKRKKSCSQSYTLLYIRQHGTYSTHQLKQIKTPCNVSFQPPQFQGFVYVSNFPQSQMNFKSMHVRFLHDVRWKN